jgi:hypothetical protein
MKRAGPTPWLGLALLLAGFCRPLAAAEVSAAGGATVELPPMMVEESVTSAPWLYAQTGDTEVLSRCSPSTTRRVVEMLLTQRQLLRRLVPDEFLLRMDVPAVCVLYAQDLKQAVSAEIQRELQAADGGAGAGRPARETHVGIAPNMRLNDRDMHAAIIYIDEAEFEGFSLSISPGHVRFLLRGRVPELPGWLADGIERAWRAADFQAEPLTLQPLVWINAGESDALSWDAARPRALLPAIELFAPEAVQLAVRAHPRHLETRLAQAELLVRWALEAGGPTRAAFWQFAARAAEAPVTEKTFEEHFGFGYSELRDRLSDYLPQAVRRSLRLDSDPKPAAPQIEVERATPNQIARLRGEWERLASGYVQRRLPQVREPYVAQARRTLRRAFDAGDRDPRLLAALGLCEIEAENEAGARQFLEPAVAAGVMRPRAHFELARLRFAELRRAAPEAAAYSFTQLAPIIEPLRHALAQAPPLAEVYVMLAEAWERCEVAPNTGEFAELEKGARLFAQRPSVAVAIARAIARHGRNSRATELLATAAGHAADEDTRALLAQLRTEITAASPRPAGNQAPAGPP